MTITITGIAGSLRRGSLNRRLLAAAAAALQPGTELVVWDDLAQLPAFSEDLEAGPVPAAVAGLRAAIARADGLLIATPEYNGSVSGGLKNAIDWASRPHRASALAGKPAAVISASPTPYGAASAQADLRKILRIAGAGVLEAGLAVPRAPAQFTPAGQLADPALREGLARVLAELTRPGGGPGHRAGRLATLSRAGRPPPFPFPGSREGHDDHEQAEPAAVAARGDGQPRRRCLPGEPADARAGDPARRRPGRARRADRPAPAAAS